MWFIGVEVEQETSAPPPKKNPVSAPDSHARDMYGNSQSQGTCVLLEIPSMHKLVQYFQSLYT